MLLPARDDSWQPAGSLAFGDDWAAAIEVALPTSPARDRRRQAYAALDSVSPGPETLVASPERLLEQLGHVTTPVDPETGEPMDPVAWLHAFLLRLGVWETLPVEAFDDAGQTNRDRFPWANDPLSEERDKWIARDGWIFGESWFGGEHRNVWVARDFRFRWNLADAAAAKPVMTSRLIGLATGLYEDLRYLTVFCRRCRPVGTRPRGQATAPTATQACSPSSSVAPAGCLPCAMARRSTSQPPPPRCGGRRQSPRGPLLHKARSDSSLYATPRRRWVRASGS